MKEGFFLKKNIKNQKLFKALPYFALFTITTIAIICSCIVYFSLTPCVNSAPISQSCNFNMDPISTLNLNTILPQEAEEKKITPAVPEQTKSVDVKNSIQKATPKAPTAPPPKPVPSPAVDYTTLYPHLYAERPAVQTLPPKTAFLTFDDGPSERTAEVLDILKERNIKATFFVTGKTSEFAKSMMRRIVNEGHTIAVHTFTHEFRQIYSSVQAYLDDFNNIYTLIYNVTGVKPSIFRFPGGSKNGFNRNNYREIINEMTRRGFDYFDWNVSAGDAVSRTPTPVQNCIANVLNHSAGLNSCVVLMHDLRPKTTTVQALPDIINGLAAQGFTFDKLSHDIDPSSFSLVHPYR